ncbi:glycine/sarcosine/betaine reductase complex component C subunit beta [Sedimentibacter sp.]|uniref:glycine/sarcosine/betaine reductase complex component C subunit beta n=1 Tax=Sedimentibacter sp. TaxID=1960295 RepID=UPI00289884A9|nr:glycine/sarcosine/betaine reductase complex component C subunit beta [Sedimentibacter sp.]
MNSVIKGTSYILVHAPDMVIHNGTTQTTERTVNPNSEYLKQIKDHLRSFEQVVSYLPNQTYIGSLHPQELGKYEQPWQDKSLDNADRFGKYGEIMPQDEFIVLMQMCDVFDLVKLENNFLEEAKNKLKNHPLFDDELMQRVKAGDDADSIKKYVDEEHAEPLYNNGALVGCVKRAHDIDVNLNAHVMHENLVSKASNVLALLNLVYKNNINKEDVEYVIDCSEEACGDMNQRGGGNFAKACAEVAGFVNATGSDTRGFCAGPAHALIEAAALVKAGVFKNVVVSAGGATAKLGMNGKDHIKKGLPVLEDVLGGFAVLVSENDGINPEINLDLVGRHTVGTGSSPQAVITSLVSSLDKAGMKITDVDKYSVEMQNPDITKPAGAGDVPLANYKMIGALAVKRGDIEKGDLASFAEQHGMQGWAPTQGHIPSGVPYIGFCRQDILDGKIKNTMIVGKGSLFLGRMTNLFDGVSFIIEANKGKTEPQSTISEEKVKELIAQALKNFASNLMAE